MNIQELTGYPYAVYNILLDNIGSLTFKKEILEKIYGKYYEKDYFKGRCLSVYINKIRKYLIKNKLNYQIKTISKSGFILEKLNKNI